MSEDKKTGSPRISRWSINIFVALTVLIILFGLAFLISGKEIIERPILVFFLLLAWVGLLSGIALGRSSF
jgi:predicted membrane channel-forming protein YqfA (hemolysin III family)